MIVSTHRILAAAILALTLAIATSTTARAEVTLEMAYMPIVPCSQLFVIEGMGWSSCGCGFAERSCRRTIRRTTGSRSASRCYRDAHENAGADIDGPT